MQNSIYLEQYVRNKISKSYNKCHADLNLSLRIALSIAFRHAAHYFFLFSVGNFLNVVSLTKSMCGSLSSDFF